MGEDSTGTSNSANLGQDIAMGQAVAKINQDFKEKELSDKAKTLGLGYVDIIHQPINPDVFDLISYEQAVALRVIPFIHLGDTVSLAVVNHEDPATVAKIQELKEKYHVVVRVYLATEEGMDAVFGQFANHFTKREVIDTTTERPAENTLEKELIALAALGERLHSLGQSMAGLAELERGAMIANASDIHFQPNEKTASVRFRIDGVLNEVTKLESQIYNFFTTQIKHKAGMKINVNDVPQDGRYTFMFEDRKIDVRVSSLPTEFGDSLVLRLLDSQVKKLDLDVLGYIDPTLQLLKEAQELSQGMVMVTGPTGSGKSTTLYTLLQSFNSPEKKVITLEDPVEYKIPGIVQSPIKNNAGYTFEKGLKAILRQDPDVIMVGEIRDQITAETAAQASLTGHVVLCTLHTNNAIEAIPRFINMGVKPFIAAPALNIIVAQRLVRNLCECKESINITESEKLFIDKILSQMTDIELDCPNQVFQPKGCSKCSNTGFKGRLVIAEGFKVTDNIAELVLNGASLKEVEAEIKRTQKMRSMLEDGVIKVLQGLTTVAEIKRVAMF